MNPTAELLLTIRQSVQDEVQPRLRGFLGGIFRAYLPQSWVFRTEQGVASLTVDQAGQVSVLDAAASAPDVTVEVGHERLRAALATRRRDGLPPGPLSVTPHTTKGRTAFDYVRPRLGL